MTEIVNGTIVNLDAERRSQLVQEYLDYFAIITSKFLIIRCIQVDLDERFHLNDVHSNLVAVQSGGLIEIQIFTQLLTSNQIIYRTFTEALSSHTFFVIYLLNYFMESAKLCILCTYTRLSIIQGWPFRPLARPTSSQLAGVSSEYGLNV